MGFYQDQVVPLLTSLSMQNKNLAAYRKRVEGAGFRLERLETSYILGPKPMTFMYEGSARPR
jgi:hypothetical protein